MSSNRAAESFKSFAAIAEMDEKHLVPTVTSTLESGLVFLSEKAPWLDDFLSELSVFPYGKHDDQADLLSQALDRFKSKGGGIMNSVLAICMKKQIEERGGRGEPTSQNPWDY